MLSVFWARAPHTHPGTNTHTPRGTSSTTVPQYTISPDNNRKKQSCDGGGGGVNCVRWGGNIRWGRLLEGDLSTAGALHMGKRLPGYSEQKLPSKFKPGVEEREYRPTVRRGGEEEEAIEVGRVEQQTWDDTHSQLTPDIHLSKFSCLSKNRHRRKIVSIFFL